MAEKKRVLIIGLDGFTWNIGKRLLDEGVMPNLAKLVETGSAGDLKSVMPFETSPAWSSFQTGCCPDKTGIFAFHSYNRRKKKLGLNSLADNAMPTLWEIAHKAGKTIVSLNMPVSYPPPKVNGVIIPGLLCPKISEESVHPGQAYDKYIKPRKEYMIVNNDHRDTVAELAQQCSQVENSRCEVALELMQDIDWDIFSVQMQSTDLIQHRAWHALEPTAEGYNDADREDVLTFYRCCDEALGRIVKAAGDDTLRIIVSDHGFCNAQGWVSINVWLKQHGYLHLKTQPESKWKAAKRRIPLLKKLAGLYGNMVAGTKTKGSTPVFGAVDLENMLQAIDFDRTQAICVGGMGGILYTDGDTEQRAVLAKRLTDELMADLGPESDNPAIASVRSGTDEYGKRVPADTLPDLVIEYCNGFESVRNPRGQKVSGTKTVNGKQGGTHRRNGIFVLNGSDIKTDNTESAELIDIMPTVLAYMGIKIPKHVDGKVLDNMFTERINADYEDMTLSGRKEVELSDSEESEVEKQLRDLGYL